MTITKISYKIKNNEWIYLFKVSKRPHQDALHDRITASGATAPWWPELELKILPHLAQSIDFQLINGFCCSRYLNNRINLPNMIGSFESGTTTF